MADNDRLLEQIREIVREETEPIKKRLDGLEQGQQEIRRDMVTKSDLQTAKQEINTKIEREVTDVVEIIHGVHDFLTTLPEKVADLRKRIEQLEKKWDERPYIPYEEIDDETPDLKTQVEELKKRLEALEKHAGLIKSH